MFPGGSRAELPGGALSPWQLVPREPEPIPGHSGCRVCCQPHRQGQQWHQNVPDELAATLGKQPQRSPRRLTSPDCSELPAQWSSSGPARKPGALPAPEDAFSASVGITANKRTSRTRQAKCSGGCQGTMRLCKRPRPERSSGGLTGTRPSQPSCPQDSSEPASAAACFLHSEELGHVILKPRTPEPLSQVPASPLLPTLLGDPEKWPLVLYCTLTLNPHSRGIPCVSSISLTPRGRLGFKLLRTDWTEEPWVCPRLKPCLGPSLLPRVDKPLL